MPPAVAVGEQPVHPTTVVRRLAGPVSRRWMNLSLRSKGMVVLAVPLTMSLVATTVFFAFLAEVSEASDRVSAATGSTPHIAQVSRLVLEAETGLRGYLASGDERFLEPASVAREQLPPELDRLAASLRDDPDQGARVDRLRAALEPGHQVRLPAGLSPQSSPEAIGRYLQTQMTSTNGIRGLLEELAREELRQFQLRRAERDAWVDRARAAAVGILVLGVGGGLAAMLVFTVGVSRRLERVVARSDDLREGEVPDFVDSGRDEIGILSRRLTEAAGRWWGWKNEAQAARVAAETANQAKTEFLSRMSHELRTPLNAVLGFAQLLEMDLDEPHQDSVRQIRRAGRHLLDLINEVLDISRIEAGQLALSPEAVSVWDVVDEVVELMGPVAAARRVRIELTAVTRCRSHVLADRQRTKQVILNLVSNAVKYNHDGGLVSLRFLRDGDTGVVEVRDTGIGIAPEDLARLFVPFERLVPADSEIEGTGVGLALSQRLATAMNGGIEVSSVPGQGSTFRLRLPIAPEPEATAPQVQPEVATSRAPAAEEAGLSVLSIEDNLANTRLLHEIIARRPEWRLVTAGQGQLGLDLAASDPPDLILLDLHLPDVSGGEVLRRLKARPQTAGVPVVILSADATLGRVDRLRAAGAEAYLTKPIDVAQLLELLDAVAERAHGGEVARDA